MNRATVLVTGAGGPAGINVVKLLKRDGFRVWATDASPYSEGFALADASYVIPPASDPRFPQELDRLAREGNVDLVIITVDEEIEVLARGRAGEKYVMHPPHTVETCLNKYLTYRTLERVLPDIVPEYSLRPQELSAELVVSKPVKGRGGRGVAVGKRDEFVEKEGVFFVEYLPGDEWTVDVVTSREGELLAAVPRRRLKIRAGVSVIGEVRLDGRVMEYTERVLESMEFTGPLNIQFKENARGELKLQEINLRFSGALDISAAAGVNLPSLLVRSWLYGERVDFRVKEGRYVRVPEAYEWR
ncbi:MAG: ATP-grasp domain-containing protein [Acidilobaceae archaeon]|nr:ATP-grasp domain-containing protein [Acidilobaceae archaeon]MCX8166039.1 ATP-grasp domain-containing protein [Acidilobaceae archaeon]MDW7974682.1 ATP-grasp domain-containing protein [Sulfolobales archaeon]